VHLLQRLTKLEHKEHPHDVGHHFPRKNAVGGIVVGVFEALLLALSQGNVLLHPLFLFIYEGWRLVLFNNTVVEEYKVGLSER